MMRPTCMYVYILRKKEILIIFFSKMHTWNNVVAKLTVVCAIFESCFKIYLFVIYLDIKDCTQAE